MRNLAIVTFLCLIPMALYEGLAKRAMLRAIGFCLLLAFGTLALALNWI
ncbi:MAG TPA: hypothetical protein VKB50_18115 [Vicinamibacterales bacterium]|nr:hypothetical protein [Vicinamibacterales bacterium]